MSDNVIRFNDFRRSPIVRRLLPKESNGLLTKWHYLGEVRVGTIAAYGHEEGCCVFTNCRSRIYESKIAKGEVLELARMVGMPGHEWAMSSLMSIAVKTLKADYPNVRLLVTYADPREGHTGAVYRSANWAYDGIYKGGHLIFYIDGKQISPRGLYNRHGTQSVPVMRQIYGSRLRTEPRPPKHRFTLKLK